MGALALYGEYRSPGGRLQYGVFQVVSIMTTTGYTASGYAWWPSFLPVLLLVLSFSEWVATKPPDAHVRVRTKKR